MRIVVMGTGGFAVPTFRALLKSKHEVAALFTRPSRQVHRRGKSAPSNPMLEVGDEHSLTIFKPESVNSPEAASVLQSLDADLLMVCDYGQILSADTLSLAKLGGINLHGSLLPNYRGAAPINWAIYHGEKETGVTVIHMTPKMDAGPCLIKKTLPIDLVDDAVTVEERLSHLGVDAVFESIQMLDQWDGHSSIGVIQDKSLATKAPRLKKSDAKLDWNRSARQIFDHVRAFKPWPGTYTHWLRNGTKEIRLLVEEVEVDEDFAGEPATVLQADQNGIVVACSQNAIRIKTVHPAGKRSLPAAEFLRGYPVRVGESFQ